MADENTRPLLYDAVLKSNEELTLQLLQQGHNPNVLDHLGMAPLHYAVYRGDYDTVKILLENGANPDLRTDDGGTALYHAEDDFDLPEIAALLRQHGAVLKWQLPEDSVFDQSAKNS